jgi:hypothetical protein
MLVIMAGPLPDEISSKKVAPSDVDAVWEKYWLSEGLSGSTLLFSFIFATVFPVR